MKAIASYYIKTLFLWKIDEIQNDKTYWQGKLSFLFRAMVEKFYLAIQNKNIPYYWNSQYNLIEGLKPGLQKVYGDKLKLVLSSIDANEPEKVVSYLLTTNELTQFKSTEFYQKQSELPNVTPQMSVVDSPLPDLSLSEHVKTLRAEMEQLRTTPNQKDKKMAELEAKLNDLADRVGIVEDRLERLEHRDRERQRQQSFIDSENSIADLVGGARSLRLDNQCLLGSSPKPLIDLLTPVQDEA